MKAESYSTKDLFIWASYYCHKNLFTDGSSKRAFLFYPRPSKLGLFCVPVLQGNTEIFFKNNLPPRSFPFFNLWWCSFQFY